MIKGISQWVVIVLVVILIVFITIVSGLVSLDAEGKIIKTLDEAEIRGVCDYLSCPGACCEDDGGKVYDQISCTKNDTVSFRDKCTDSTGMGMGSTHVKEYYCNGNVIESEIHSCGGLSTCLDGACI